MARSLATRKGKTLALGGGLEGADRTSRTLSTWSPPVGSTDVIINRDKETADARGKDLARNDASTANMVAIHRNSIVGSEYRLTAKPNWRVMSGQMKSTTALEGWAKESAAVIENRFRLYCESPSNWFDASRRNSFTGLIRLAVGSFALTGEVLSVAEWIRESDRPYKTAVQMVSPSRLSNPQGGLDTAFMRRGIEIDARGKPLFANIQKRHPGDGLILAQFDANEWVRVPFAKPWGRTQVLHIVEQMEPAQTRGVSDLVSVLESISMLKKFRGIVLQSAAVNASYAATLETEFPNEMAAVAMGKGDDKGLANMIGQYLEIAGNYYGDGNNIKIDGVRIPQLVPGTKLNMRPIGTPGGVGTDFESSLLRYIAGPLGVSAEELSKDYSKVSYASGRLAVAATERYMAARKKLVADRAADTFYALWLEEELNQGNVPSLPGTSQATMLRYYYEPASLFKDALSEASWIGASAGQVDELKETQAALMRIKGGLSTYEIEAARLGTDYRELMEQAAREQALIKELDLPFSLDATVAGKAERQSTFTDSNGGGKPK